eukprot:TRINITY_DN20866_c0_g1_i1.p1 TRINITY_DN20866_c0_g1~~TRINITY_DN20866_c0_g1_i1.p1  ORF type:complete len:167 (+),score=96.10 TRINITY_DN20866_c0_g1_i1:62-562(+)
MPQVLTSVVPTPQHEVRNIFNLFDFGITGTLEGVDTLKSALSALCLEPTDAELTKEIGNKQDFDVKEFLRIVKVLEETYTAEKECERAFELFGEGAKELKAANFEAVHKELGWEFNAERNANFIEAASAGGKFDYKVWYKVIFGKEWEEPKAPEPEPAKAEDDEEY